NVFSSDLNQGRQQHQRKPQLQALYQHYPSRDPYSRRQAIGRRAVRRLLGQIRSLRRQMNFDEHAAKSLVLAPAGIPVPRGQICRTAKEAAQAVCAIGPAVIKAQVAAGKRGKAGGIKPADTPEEAERVAAAILGMSIGEYKVERVLVEAQANIAHEFYAAVLTDTEARKPLVLVSTQGGMDMSKVAAAEP